MLGPLFLICFGDDAGSSGTGRYSLGQRGDIRCLRIYSPLAGEEGGELLQMWVAQLEKPSGLALAHEGETSC